MRKSILLLAFATSVLCCFSQAKDTILTEVQVNNELQKNNLLIITYNNACDFSHSIGKTWNAATQSWTNTSQENYTYNEAGNLIEQVIQSWDVLKNEWVNRNRNLPAYKDPLRRITTQQEWDTISNTWRNIMRSESLLNSQGNTITSKTETYTNNAWQNLSLVSIAYDAFNRITETKSAVWEASAWVSSSKSVSNYTADGDGATFYYYWDNNNKQWVKTNREMSEYLSNTVYSERTLSQYFTPTGWLNNFRSRYAYQQYNGQYQQTDAFSRLWDAATNAWVNLFSSKSEYYSDGAPRLNSFQLWDAGAHSWGTVYRSTYTHNNNCQLSSRLTAPVKQNNPSKNNSISRTFNRSGTDKNALQYDVTVAGKDPSKNNVQYGFQLVLTTAAKNGMVSSMQAVDASTTISAVVIAPNPAKHYFNITTPKNKAGIQTFMKLADVTGRTILQQKIQDGSTQQIALPALSKGVYLVTITTGTKTYSKKLVIE